MTRARSARTRYRSRPRSPHLNGPRRSRSGGASFSHPQRRPRALPTRIERDGRIPQTRPCMTLALFQARGELARRENAKPCASSSYSTGFVPGDRQRLQAGSPSSFAAGALRFARWRIAVPHPLESMPLRAISSQSSSRREVRSSVLRGSLGPPSRGNGDGHNDVVDPSSTMVASLAAMHRRALHCRRWWCPRAARRSRQRLGPTPSSEEASETPRRLPRQKSALLLQRG